MAASEWLTLAAGLALLPGCGSCAGDSSSESAPAPTGMVSPGAQRFASTVLIESPAPRFKPEPVASDASKPDAR